MSKTPDLRTEQQKEKDSIISNIKKSLRYLNSSYREIESFTQLVGGKIIKTKQVIDGGHFTNNKYLFMENNKSMIHIYKLNKNGSRRRVWSQLIGTVDKIYYKDENFDYIASLR